MHEYLCGSQLAKCVGVGALTPLWQQQWQQGWWSDIKRPPALLATARKSDCLRPASRCPSLLRKSTLECERFWSIRPSAWARGKVTEVHLLQRNTASLQFGMTAHKCTKTTRALDSPWTVLFKCHRNWRPDASRRERWPQSGKQDYSWAQCWLLQRRYFEIMTLIWAKSTAMPPLREKMGGNDLRKSPLGKFNSISNTPSWTITGATQYQWSVVSAASSHNSFNFLSETVMFSSFGKSQQNSPKFLFQCNKVVLPLRVISTNASQLQKLRSSTGLMWEIAATSSDMKLSIQKCLRRQDPGGSLSPPGTGDNHLAGD